MRRSPYARTALTALTALGATTCSTQATVNATFNFTRAADVAFLCFSVPPVGSSIRPREIRPLEDCLLASADNTPTVNPSYHLHALVTQSERGELAVVDLASTATISLVDTRASIPGFTFVPVGPSPSAVLADIRPTGLSSVWVASGGSRSVQRLDPRDLQRSVVAEVPLNGAPFDLAMDTLDGHYFVYVSVPDRHAIAVLNVDDPEHPNNLGFVALSNPSGTPDAGGAGLDAGLGTDSGGASQSPARPLGITVDALSHRLYASDDASGWVHVVGFPGPSTGEMPVEIDRLEVGEPSRSVAVTPAVRAGRCDPAVDPDHCAEAEYLYTVASAEGAVYAYDLRRRARVRANRLPEPNPANRRVDPTLGSDYRVPLPSPAVTLVTMATREYVPPGRGTAVIPCESTAMGCPSGVSPAPGQLHGLFVGALLRTGQFALVDLDDYDAQCRARSCNTGSVAETGIYQMIRHAPRAALSLDRAPHILNRPSLSSSVLGGERMVVPESSRVPTIACGASRDPNTLGCDGDFGVELRSAAPTAANGCDGGSPGDATSDSELGDITDVSTTEIEDTVGDLAMDLSSDRFTGVTPEISAAYVTRNESWGMTFEGTLPGLDLAGGALRSDGDGATLVLNADGAGFCSRGALSVEGQRDTLTLVGDPTPTTGTRASDCTALFGTGASPLRRDFAISQATQNELTLELPAELSGDEPRARMNRLIVARCFAQATRFQVRATDQWVLVGQRSGHPHAVKADAEGRCVIDDELQRATERRALNCLLARVPLSCRPTRSVCPAGRACLPRSVSGAALQAASLPITATATFCVQVYPGVEPTGAGSNSVSAVRPLRDMQITFAVTGAYEPLRFDTGMFPSSARFLPAFDRLYVVDQGNSGLLEFRTNPITRSRLFN